MMKNKILKIFLIMLLIVSSATGIIFAVTINGNKYEKGGDTYHDAFQNKGNGLFNIKWSEIKDNYYTAGGINDYQAYIVGSKDGYCLNEDTGDGKNINFYPSAIVDINGGDVTVYSKTNPNGISMYVGDPASEFAEVVYFKYNYPKRKDINSGSQNAYFGQYWVNHWGWNILYGKIGSYIGDENARPTFNKIASLENAVVAPSYNLNNLSIEKNGDLTAQNGSFTVNNQTYKTKIGKYTINYNKSLDLKVIVTDINGKEYSGIYYNGYLYFNSNITAELKSIKVSQSYTGYKARLIILSTGNGQGRMIAYANKTTISKEVNATDLPEFNVNVSLQKYITKVTTNNNTAKFDNLTTRANKGAQGAGSPITNYKKQISTNNKSSNDDYKNTKPVSIEVGDKVSYRVYVYNNGKNTAKRVEVEDTLPTNILLNDTVLSKGTCKSVTRSGGKVIASIENLGTGKSAYFEVTVHFTEYSSDKIWNTAKISSTNPTNTTSYRTEDGDSIIMELEYEVSLEKYISSVHSNNSTNNNDIINLDTYDIIKTYLITKNIPENNYKTEIQKLINNSDFNNDGKVDNEDLDLLNSYLEDEIIGKITNIYNPTLINTLKNYKLADINKDNKIDNEDIKILNLVRQGKYNNDTLSKIKEYIKYDLNRDGVINDNDVDIYKLIKLDINEDKEINIYDLYTLMLMSLDLDNDNKISNTDLYKLKSYNLRNSGASKTQIEEYIRYDLNKDEIIDDNDEKLLNRIYNNWEATELKEDGAEEKRSHSAYKENAENILSKNEEVNNYNELLNKIQETINQYDTNGDGRVSVFDNGGERLLEIIELLDVNSNGMIELEMPLTYSSNMLEIINDSDYNIVSVLSYLKEESYIIDKINENSGNYRLLDINEDGRINEEDLELYDEEFNINEDIFEMYNNEIYDLYDFTEFVASYFIENGEIDIQNPVGNYTNSDLDYNGIVNKKDYELFVNYAKLEIRNEDNNYLNTISLEGIDNVEFINRINVIKNYSIDIDADEVINEYDESLLSHYLEYNIQLPIREQITTTFIETVINSDINGDDNFTEEDLILLENYNIAKLDLNDDETINEEDVKLLIEVLTIENIDNVVESIKKSNTTNYNTRSGKAEYLTYSNGKYIDNTKNVIPEEPRQNSYKYNNIITVESGYYVTYTIKVTNDSNSSSIYITKILDTLPVEGISAYKIGGYSENEKDYSKVPENGQIEINRTSSIKLDPGESTTVLVTVKVSASNMSVEIFKNTAKITEIKNTNGITMNSDIYDKTPYNNMDSDYFQLNPGGDGGAEIIISGTVWNDRALDKIQDNYNGAFDKNSENKLSGIKVHLYRDGVTNNPIATTITNDEGNYFFADSSIDSNVITNSWERYIKGPRVANTNRWTGTYYSYNIVFEYDGITYTSTVLKDNKNCLGIYNSDYNDSNAKEDLETRINFNNDFSPVSNSSGIDYITNNQSEYIPQSIYLYNSNMVMQSSTDLIELSIDTNLEQLQHINLGLRGRDIFDLELTSDVDNIKVTVNNKVGVYQYSNKVSVRRSDLTKDSTTIEDMANRVSEASNTYVDSQEQHIRDTDINVDTSKYSAGQGLTDIQVTYKITVHNTSRTKGTASKIINYFDDNYNFVKAYSGSNEMTIGDGAEYKETGAGYESVEITTPGTMLNQSEKMDIYVVYTLNEPTETLKAIEKLATYNMAEITVYKTACADKQTEYTRGLIDKDSAPGSANTETVKLSSGSSDLTTVGYYFGGKDLSVLKYEDDTYATPTLYFVKDENQRTIEGFVFEDITTTKPITRIKTGNGTLDEGEVGVYGATVQLIEVDNAGEPIAIRYECDTNKDGYFSFSGYLSGRYIMRYYYGNKMETVLLNQASKDDGTKVNTESYNGEDFQATNNTGSYGAGKLSDVEKFWYVYNESLGISTAKDNTNRRIIVSENVTSFIDEQMTVLNNMRAGKSADNSRVTYTSTKADGTTANLVVTVDNIIEETYMYADTDPMELTVEKTELVKNDDGRVIGITQRTTFGEYKITGMNFGIAKVPVTTVDLQKEVSSFTITDATGKNIIASMERKLDGSWKLRGDVIPDLNNKIDVSIEDEKLQGARLEVTYNISVNMETEKNFDNTENVVPTITGLVDFVNNNLSYNEALGNNAEYWELITFDKLDDEFEAQRWEDGTLPEGTVDPEGKIYSTVLKAKAGNPLLLTKAGKGTATITLEKVLSSTNLSIDEIVTSTVDTSEYSNIVEITGFDYRNNTITNPGDENSDTSKVMRDRIRTKYRYIILPGVQHDTATSQVIVIHPPTGDSSISIVYYVIAIIGLIVLAIGVFGIKKFVIKK